MGSGVGLGRHMLFMTVLNYCHLCQIGKPRLQDVKQECFTQAVVHSSFCPASAQKLSNRLGPNVYRNRCLQGQVCAGTGCAEAGMCRSRCVEEEDVQKQMCVGAGACGNRMCRNRMCRKRMCRSRCV